MRDEDLQDPGNYLRDIFRETSFIMSTCVLLGLLAGFFAGFGLFGNHLRGTIFLVVFLTFAGAIAGIACGSLLDFLWTQLRGPVDPRKPRRKKRRH